MDIKVLQNIEIPPLGTNIHEALLMMRDPNVDVGLLSAKLIRDVGIMQHIFKIANSAYFSQGQSTSDIRTAIGRVGLLWVRQVLVSHALKTSFSFQANPIFDGTLFRKHSSFVAFAASELAKKRCPEHTADVFMAGMFHDVGLAAVAAFLPGKFDAMVAECVKNKIAFDVAEDALELEHHRDIGGAIAMQWNFPKNVCQLISVHDVPFERVKATLEPDLHSAAEILFLADRLAHRFGAGYRNYHRDNFISPFTLKRLDLNSEDIMAAVEQCTNALGALLSDNPLEQREG